MIVLSSASMNFAKLRVGTRARVTSVQPSEHLARLLEMGLTVGAEFEVLKLGPFGDTVEIRLRGYSLCLRQGEASGISIEVLGQPSR